MFTVKKFLTQDEVVDLLRVACQEPLERDSLMIRVLIATGCRSHELVRLRAADLTHGTLALTAAKGSNDRSLALPGDLYGDLQKYVTSHNLQAQDFLFPVGTRRVRQIWDHFRPHRMVGKGTKSARHAIGVHLYQRTRNIKTVQAVLGHKELMNTTKYMDYVESNEAITKHLPSLYPGPARKKRTA